MIAGAEIITYTPPPPDIAALINTHLLTKWKTEDAAHKSSGRKWRASGLGQCLRHQYLSRHLKLPTKQPDAQARKVFEVGKAWHNIFGDWFKDAGLLLDAEKEFSDVELDIAAFADFIIGRDNWCCGIELKSKNSTSFWYRTKYQNNTATFEQLMQAACYAILAERLDPKKYRDMHWLLVTVSKDDLTIVQDVVTPLHKVEAFRRIQVLNEAARTNTPPPCTCIDTDERGEGGWFWKYCDFYAGSEESRTTGIPVPTGEFYKIASKKGQPKFENKKVPDGPCCPVDVTDYV